MAYDEETARRVRRILSRRRDVVEKTMVGGRSFLVSGRMCCGVTATGLVVRIEREARERTLTEPYVRPMEFAGRTLAGFVRVDPAGYRTDRALARWIQRGLDVASKLPAPGRGPRRARPKVPRRTRT